MGMIPIYIREALISSKSTMAILTSNNAKMHQQDPGWWFVVHVSLCISCAFLECPRRLGRVLPKQRHITEDELEMMAAAQLRVSSICEPGRDLSIVPSPSPPSPTLAWSENLDHLGFVCFFFGGLRHTEIAESCKNQTARHLPVRLRSPFVSLATLFLWDQKGPKQYNATIR